MSREPPILLKGLNFESCWSLFRERAFALRQTEDQNLVAIGRQIVEKCQGLPMVVKLFGCLLQSVTDEDEWRSVLKEIWEVEKGEDSILQTLKVSYDQLPLHLKQCLAYCSVFPVGHEFDMDELVKLWMAEGLIPPRGNRRPEAVGNSSQEFLRVEHNEKQGGDNIVRLAFCSLNTADPVAFRQICISKSLRTFILHLDSGALSKQVIGFLLPRFNCLRVLDLRNNQLEQLPNSIGDLTHLRYLGLYNTQIKCLPESVSNLYNLQTLNLDECYKLLELPKGLSMLINLRHLNLHIDWDRWTELKTMPPGIQDLKSLQTMSRFVVSAKNGCEIRELKDLKLRGELCISKLENVENIEHADEANLKDKQYIEKLMLRWSEATHNNNNNNNSRPLVPTIWGRLRSGATSNIQNTLRAEELIKHLQPHNRLKQLRIEHYDGTHFPQWLADGSFLSLESITLSNCKRCTVLPAMDQLPNLRNLVLKNCEGLTAIPHLRNIHTLVVDGLNKSVFSMVSGLSSLSSLTISRCGDTQVQKSSFEQLTSLTKLKIEGCASLVSVASEEDLQTLISLESLEVSSCHELVSFAVAGLPQSLNSLQLCSCEKLEYFPIQFNLLASGLRTLTLSRCPLLKQQLQNNEAYLAHINEKNIQ
ncbi:putative disease resistance RPP13-like protein 1 isoform X2 [Dioscorea cayenensis subsp. rotundata]|uniref:Disease resistance RPP13-like protein 1 isoform X2 n=1 Tax=Dioscorea cayennensis subsp. rotundata TaxID=55577 RepID=A0AB40BRJ6_DIOCR|nr:putative disease resistance RPP13-like protein 1 isoform X2 [Dioscorea cayenensis subsp. rotundata]